MQLHFACGSGPLLTTERGKREDFTFHFQGVPGSAAPGGAGREEPQGGKRDSADKRCLNGGSAGIPMQPGRNTSRNTSRSSSPGSVSPFAGGVGSAAQPCDPGQSRAVPPRLPEEFQPRAGTGSCIPGTREGLTAH